MLRQIAVLFIVSLMILAPCFKAVPSPAKTDDHPPSESEIRELINKIGVGGTNKIKVELKNGTMLKGAVSQIDNASFSLFDNQKTHATTIIAYQDVKQIRYQSTAHKMKITMIILAGLLVLGAVTWVFKKVISKRRKASEPL
jgi:small nuclear ribonucleoprotein (snRNP)-like protein